MWFQVVFVVLASWIAKIFIFPPNYILDRLNIPGFVYYRFKTGDEKQIAITFDDSPVPGSTATILKACQKHDIKATFFAIGEQIKVDSLVGFRTTQHQIANHDWQNRMSARVDPQQLLADINQTDIAITKYAPWQTRRISWFRPGCGLYVPSMLRNLKPTHKIAMASFYIRDAMFAWLYGKTGWKIWPWIVANHALVAIQPGSIIVLHDGSIVRGKFTSLVLDMMVPTLKRQGYEFLTLDEMHDKFSQHTN